MPSYSKPDVILVRYPCSDLPQVLPFVCIEALDLQYKESLSSDLCLPKLLLCLLPKSL